MEVLGATLAIRRSAWSGYVSGATDAAQSVVICISLHDSAKTFLQLYVQQEHPAMTVR